MTQKPTQEATKQWSSPRMHLLICMAVGGALCLLMALCNEQIPRSRAKIALPPACPLQRKEEPARAARMWRQLRMTALGARLTQGVVQRSLRLCFGDVGPSVIRSDGVIYMDRRLTYGEDTARLGHLLHHHRDPIRLNKRLPCLPQLRRALRQEAAAIAAELRLRRAFGVFLPHRWFAFGAAFWHTASRRQHDLIYRQLWRHPRGARGVPALRSQYQQALGCQP